MSVRGRTTLLGLALSVVACDDTPDATGPAAPTIVAAAVAANPHNAISAIVHIRASSADSVAVRVAAATGDGSSDVLTPAVRVAGDSAAVPVLGLVPSTAYVLQPIVYGAGKAAGPELAFASGALPSDIPRYSAGGPDPSPGFVVLAAGLYGLVLDNTGRVVWYRRFPEGPGLNFVAGFNGRYAARPPTINPADAGAWVEVDPLGNETRRLTCANGLRPRLHDLIADPDGSYWLLCDETRTMDLSAIGGVAGARVTGTVVQHIAADGDLRFSWSAFDHFALTDVAESERTGASVNWTHGNSIDVDIDGHLIVSFRNLGEVTKIDGRTGSVLWRMGGRANEIAFVDVPPPSFVGQHSARSLGAGEIVLLDNIGDPVQSRTRRFVVDEATRSARLVQSYASTPGVSTLIGGSVQPLPRGRTLVSFGTAGRVEEYDDSGRVVWRIDGHAGYVFRAQRIRSLYAPGVGTSR